VMGGIDRQNSSLDFSGGDVTVFMGGGELDLRQAQVAGGDAVVQIFAMWGGYTFKVPSDWDVTVDVLPLLGGVSDLRSHHEHREGAPRFTLKGVVIMGGIELKN
jgi:predicted membrane protein